MVDRSLTSDCSIPVEDDGDTAVGIQNPLACRFKVSLECKESFPFTVNKNQDIFVNLESCN